MDSSKDRNGLKPGDKIIELRSGRIFSIRYFIGDKPVVSNGEFDFPLIPSFFVPWSPLLEELV